MSTRSIPFTPGTGPRSTGPFSRAVVQQYRAALELEHRSPSTINVQLAALRKLASEAADNGLLAPELAAGISKVRGARQAGSQGRELAYPRAGRATAAPARCDAP